MYIFFFFTLIQIVSEITWMVFFWKNKDKADYDYFFFYEEINLYVDYMVASNKKSNTMSNNSASKVFCHQRLNPAYTREGDFKGKGRTTSFM